MLAVETYGFVERPARGLHDGAFDLVANAVGVDWLSAVDRGDDPTEVDPTGFVLDPQFQSNCAVCAEIFVAGEGKAPAMPLARRF